MKLLLDTNALIWLLDEPHKLAQGVLRDLRNPDNALFASTASRWEIAIKKALGKLSIPAGFDDAVQEQRIAILPVTWAHARAVEVLPMIHRDPFDRLLVAQAIVEDAILVSSDPQLFRYPVRTLRASP